MSVLCSSVGSDRKPPYLLFRFLLSTATVFLRRLTSCLNHQPVSCLIQSFAAALCISWSLEQKLWHCWFLMNHQVSLAPMSSDFSAELRLEYCLFSSCVMSQLERTEAFGPEQWNNASSITGCWPLGDGFPSSCSVELISAMCFSVYVYRRPKGLFVFPLVALWLVSPQTCLKHCYLWPDAFFHRELLNHVNLPSPEFQMQAVEKLAIASTWQVGSISVLSSCKAWAS